MYPSILPSARRILDSQRTQIIFVDVGSRNGIIELAGIAPFVKAYGFEPNPEEYKKLMSGKTDAAAYGIVSPKYSSIQYYPYALGEQNGTATFYVTAGPGAAGLLPPNPERLSETKWQGATYRTNIADEIFAINKTIQVTVKTLKSFAKEESLASIDYLKIDVEGSEYEVLKGAGDLLSDILIVKVEVCFVHFRKNQKLFSDVDILMRKFGFDLLRYEISPVQIAFKERTTGWSFGPTIGFPERFGQPVQSDAIYVNRAISNPKRAFIQAMILLEKNYLDEALFILRTRAHLSDPDFLALLKNYRPSWKIRLLDSMFKLGRKLFNPHPHNWK